MPDRNDKLTYLVDDSQATNKLKAIEQHIKAIELTSRGAVPAIGQLDRRLEDLGVNTAGVIRNASTEVKNLGSSILGILPTWQALEFGVQILQQFGELTSRARKHMYDLTEDELRTLLIPPTKREDLLETVLACLMGEDDPVRSDSNWVRSSLLANGLVPESVPADDLPFVLFQLEATNRIVPLGQFAHIELRKNKIAALLNN